MPIYEYRCDEGHTFEVMQRMTEEPLSACESCGAPARRVFHPVAVHFKGSGFYNTDYGKSRGAKKGGESKETSSSSSSSESSSSSSSSESKSSGD